MHTVAHVADGSTKSGRPEVVSKIKIYAGLNSVLPWISQFRYACLYKSMLISLQSFE